MVLECSGAPPAISAALSAVRRAGVVVQIGMLGAGTPSDRARSPGRQGGSPPAGAFRFNDEIDEAVRLLATNQSIEAVITHVVPADDVATAFTAAKDSERSGKVLVDLWWENP